MREHGGLAWPPRLSALRQPRLLFPEVFTHTKVGRTIIEVMKEVEGAPAAKKEMAMAEFNMAKEKMTANMAQDCMMHLDAASKASMKQ